MKSSPITQRAATKYGSAPENQEVTVDAGGKSPANFARMSPIKQVDLVKGASDLGASKGKPASWNKSESGETREISTKVKKRTKKPYVGAERDACSSVYIAKHGDAACKKYNALSDERKEAANYTTTEEEQIETITDPGETYTGDLYKEQFGVGRDSYGSRQDRRQVQSTTRGKKRADIAYARQQMKSGEITREEFKKKKKEAKLNMAKERVDQLDTLEKNLKYQQEQGQEKGGTVRLDDRVRTFGEYSDKEQMEMGLAQQQAEKAEREANASKYKNLFGAKAALLAAKNAYTIGSGIEDFNPSMTPSLTKPKGLMYDLSQTRPTQRVADTGLSNSTPDAFRLARGTSPLEEAPGIGKKTSSTPFKMKGFMNKK